MPLNGRKQMPKAHAGCENDNFDFARQESVGEVNGHRVLVQRYLAHGRAHEWLPRLFFNEPLHFGRHSAFKGGDAKPAEVPVG